MSEPEATDPASASLAELLRQLSQDSRRLVRDEIALAQIEMKGKARQAGVGVGLFGAAGILVVAGLGALVATGIIALSVALDTWLAALIVTAVLFVAAGIAALVGKKQTSDATPALPEQTVDNIKKDVAELRGERP